MEHTHQHIQGLLRDTLKPAVVCYLVVTLRDGNRSRIDATEFTSHAQAQDALSKATAALRAGLDHVDFQYTPDNYGCTFTLRTLPGCVVRTCSLHIMSV